MTHWHTMDSREVVTALRSTERGLSAKEASLRLERNGPNELPTAKPQKIFWLFIDQFQSPLIFVLAAAALVLLAINELTDALIIYFVLLFNAVVGTIQEGRSERTFRALNTLTAGSATIVRGGQEMIVPDRMVVPGDVIIVQEGERVSADGRILEANGLVIDEAALTGESVPVGKTVERMHKLDAPVADRTNMVYKGTNVLSGDGKIIVTATGANTVVGSIAQSIATVDTEIPLRGDIRRLSRIIVLTVFLLSLALFSFGFFYGRSPIDMFTTVVALSVSIIPEGLPIVITLVLATGVWRMSKRNVLVKRLQAVEALGQSRVIAVDKTGTITKNELVVRKVYAGGETFEILGEGYEPRGGVRLHDQTIEPLNHPDLVAAAKVAALNPNARLSFLKESKTWKVAGDPTEAAMLVFAEKIGFKRPVAEAENPRIFERPFDYKEKYHLTLHRAGRSEIEFIAGAPEIVLSRCDHLLVHGKTERLTEDARKELETVFGAYANKGMRVVAIATRHLSSRERQTSDDKIENLTFVAYLAMQDAIRPEARAAVRQSHAAGMRVVMITGDHKDAARATASEVGIFRRGDRVLTGKEVEAFNDAELANALGNVTVFARVTPEDKLRIINAYKHRHEIIAMTGDGVNDAPSLVAADLGLAMGTIGTEVAKEASDIVILDDNFSSIVAGIEEGRNIYRTIQKVILYLFSTSVGEVLTIVGSLFLGWPLPLAAAQIIWLNFVTDGFLDVSLAMDPSEHDLLDGTFKRPGRFFIDGLMVKRAALMALPMMIGALLLFGIYAPQGITKAWTVTLTVLAAFQWFNAWNCRSESKSIVRKDAFSNRYLVAATITIAVLQVLAIYVPFLQKILHTTALGLGDWLAVIATASSIVVIEEIRKFFYRRRALSSQTREITGA